MKYTYSVVVVDLQGSTTYNVFAQGIEDAIRLGLYARNKQDVTSVTSVTVTRTSN
jgi:hypothetical protein